MGAAHAQETAYTLEAAYAWGCTCAGDGLFVGAGYAWERAVPGLNGCRGMGDVCKTEVIFLAGLGKYIDNLM